MTRFRNGLVLMVVLCLPARGRATEVPTAVLSANLRNLILKYLPDPLYENTKHWGTQKDVANGVTWRGQGLNIHPETQYKPMNHGKWWKVRVTTPVKDSFVFELRDMQQPEPGRMTFTTFFAINADVDYDRQIWEEGTRLWSGSVRARMRIMVTLQCEATTHLESSKGFPDMVYRLHVVKSDVHYDELVIEHIPGLGGEAAKIIGGAVRSAVKHLHPALERKLIDKANAAILKAGDTKEIHVSLSKLFGK